MKAVCIVGKLDRTVVDSSMPKLNTTAGIYRLELIAKDGWPILSFYVQEEIATSASSHMVFAAYAKKGKL